MYLSNGIPNNILKLSNSIVDDISYFLNVARVFSNLKVIVLFK